MQTLREEFDLGDFIEASGVMFRTRTGEITLQVHAFHMLAKSITPLPAAKDEVVDGQVAAACHADRPRNPLPPALCRPGGQPGSARDFPHPRPHGDAPCATFWMSADFLEVETPILQPIYGGAAAQPFVTHHNQLKQDLYLRISFELYLKRLLVGMLDRVYEIGRDFRNEGVSFKHNPEFTQLEFYMAYADYLKVMELTEQMIVYVCDKVLGTRILHFDGQEIDVNPPWRRVELRQGLIDTTGIDIQAYPDAESLAEAMRARNIPAKPGSPRGKLIDALLGDYLEPTFIQPTFLYDYPRDISPLAKSMPATRPRWSALRALSAAWSCAMPSPS